MPSMPGLDDNMDRGPRLFHSTRNMPLEDAFTNLSLAPDWLTAFRESGEHYENIRYTWRREVLRHHPDKQPADLDEEALVVRTAAFTRAMASFETIDAFYQQRFGDR